MTDRVRIELNEGSGKLPKNHTNSHHFIATLAEKSDRNDRSRWGIFVTGDGVRLKISEISEAEQLAIRVGFYYRLAFNTDMSLERIVREIEKSEKGFIEVPLHAIVDVHKDERCEFVG